MSIGGFSPRAVSCGLIGAATLIGCGWHVGPPPVAALSVSAVDGAPVQPGLAAAVEGGVVRALRDRGVAPGGPVVRATILVADERAVAGGSAGSVVREAALTLIAGRSDRPACAVEASGRRSFAAPDPAALGQARTAAWDRLARQVGDRVVDALLAEAACR